MELDRQKAVKMVRAVEVIPKPTGLVTTTRSKSISIEERSLPRPTDPPKPVAKPKPVAGPKPVARPERVFKPKRLVLRAPRYEPDPIPPDQLRRDSRLGLNSADLLYAEFRRRHKVKHEDMWHRINRQFINGRWTMGELMRQPIMLHWRCACVWYIRVKGPEEYKVKMPGFVSIARVLGMRSHCTTWGMHHRALLNPEFREPPRLVQ